MPTTRKQRGKEMIYAVVGSREGIAKEKVEAWLRDHVMSHDIIVTGGAIGVDSYAINWCREHNISCITIKPSDLSRKGDYLLRNHFIVDLAAYIVAFWNEKSRGTKYLIDCAQSTKKVLVIEKN